MIRTFASLRALKRKNLRKLRRIRSNEEKPYEYWAFCMFAFSAVCTNFGQYCILKCNPLILLTFWGGESPGPDNVEDQRSRYSCQWQQREKVRRRRNAQRKRRRRAAGRRNNSRMMQPALEAGANVHGRSVLTESPMAKAKAADSSLARSSRWAAAKPARGKALRQISFEVRRDAGVCRVGT